MILQATLAAAIWVTYWAPLNSQHDTKLSHDVKLFLQTFAYRLFTEFQCYFAGNQICAFIYRFTQLDVKMYVQTTTISDYPLE